MPKIIHGLSALSVTVIGSIAAFDWTGIVSPHTAGIIVTALGAAKLVATFVFDNTPSA